MRFLSDLERLPTRLLRAKIGIDVPTFKYLFSKYGGQGTPIPTPYSLFSMLNYLKQYNVCTIHGGSRFLLRVKKKVAYLASRVNEMELIWKQRHMCRNRTVHCFRHRCTGYIDCTVFRITRNRKNEYQRAHYSGKHKTHCFKVITFVLCNRISYIVEFVCRYKRSPITEERLCGLVVLILV